MGVAIKFYQDKIELKAESKKLGHPHFVDADFIEIIIPGDDWNIIKRKATELDIEKYRPYYDKYKAGLEQSEDGMPLEQWAMLTKSQVENYKSLSFTTVEQIAEMSDTSAAKVGMGATEHKAAAQAFLQQAVDGALVQRQAVQIEEQANDIEELKRQIQELAALASDKKETLTLPKKKGK